MVVSKLVEGSPDVLAAVELDAAGSLLTASDDDAARARELADLTRQLVERADAAASAPVEQIEVQAAGGSVFAVRGPQRVLACVTRRPALSSLVLYDLRHALRELEAV